MLSTRFLWRSVGLTALLSTFLCVFGFVYAFNQIIFPKAVLSNDLSPSSEQTLKPIQSSLAAKEKIQIVALGDSLTAGTGDLTGRGYVGQTKEKLEKQLGKPVFILNNFAIPGFRTADVLKDMEAKKDIGTAIAGADLVLLTIGGNDLFEGGKGIFNDKSAEDGFNAKAAEERLPEAVKRLEQIIDRVAKLNPNAIICYVGLYHPFLDIDTRREGTPTVQKWNSTAFEIAHRYPNIIVVPTYDLFELSLNKYLYTDHFHPNQDGYERIADRIVQIVK